MEPLLRVCVCVWSCHGVVSSAFCLGCALSIPAPTVLTLRETGGGADLVPVHLPTPTKPLSAVQPVAVGVVVVLGGGVGWSGSSEDDVRGWGRPLSMLS